MRSQGVYIECKDRQRRYKSECLTIDGLTPKQALREIAEFLRTRQKAG